MVENRFTADNNPFDWLMIIILTRDIIQTLQSALLDARKEMRK